MTGTLADLARKANEEGVQSPALLIVGEVTRLHETLRWFNAAAQSNIEASEAHSMSIRNGLAEAIGNTPLIRLSHSASTPAARFSARPSS